MDPYEQFLRELYGLAHRGIQPGLERVHAALHAIGDPHRSLAVVHVAGTNGKGSTCAMIAAGLPTHRVALYTSPHLATLLERLAIFGAPQVERAEVVEAWQRVKPACGELTFFEALTVTAFVLFAQRGCDLVVLETGLGGRLDATNVIARPIACAITRIGLDHQRFLGSTIAQIAKEKAGILKASVPCAVAPQLPEAREVIETEGARVGAPITWVERDESIRCALPGDHQRDNAATALAVLEELARRGYAVDPRAAVEDVRWPGRLEWIGNVLFDAAHNEDGARSLATHLAARDRRRRVLVFGAMADKPWPTMLALLAPHVDRIVFTAAALSRAEDPAAMTSVAEGVVVRDPAVALEHARTLAGPDGEIVIAGSIYLMGELRARVLGMPTDPPIAM